MKPTTPLSLAVLLAAARLQGEAVPVSPAVQASRAIRALAAGASNAEEARKGAAKLPGALGARFTEHNAGWRLTFEHPLPGRDFCQGMGWDRPYASSSDTHQSSWQISLWRLDLLDFYKRPVLLTAKPRVGRWAVKAWLTGRPQGELPNVSHAGSPAYDLLRYEALVGGIEVVPWKPEYDGLWLVEQSRRAHEKTPLLTVTAQPASYSGPCPVEITFDGILHGIRREKVEIRWERSDGVWTEIEPVAVRRNRQPVHTRWRVGRPGQTLEVWQKLHLGPSNRTSEPAKAQIRCE